LWFNSNSNKLNVYDGSNWRPVGSPFVSNTRPTDLVAGDMWIDRGTQQLKFFDGSNLIVAGPNYTVNQGRTGWITEEIIDRRGNTQIVASMYVADTRVAIFNRNSFDPLQAIPGFTLANESLLPGLSFSTLVNNNNINAPAEIAIKLLDAVDGELDSTKFVRSDKNGAIEGSLTIASNDGIIVGSNANFSVFIEPIPNQLESKTLISNGESNSKMVFEVKSEDEFQTPLELDPVEKQVSIYLEDQWQTNGGAVPKFNVNADTTIRGSLTVIGATQFTNSTTIQISDKNIELAVVSNPTNTTANGAGITVLGPTNSNKTITWMLNSIFVNVNTQKSAWELSDNIKIPPANAYHVGNFQVLSLSTLGDSVLNSSLTSVGDLVDLTAADFTFIENNLTVNNVKDLIITVDATKLITLSNRVRITNVADPFNQFDVSNKDYVDAVKTNNNFLTVDVTGFLDPNNEAVPQINALFPSLSARLGDQVRVLCLSYANLPTVSRVVKSFRCELVTGVRAWVYQQDITL
jgi:hypothetical protein